MENGQAGLEGADAFCQERAEAAGLPGQYTAWLADSNTSAISRVGDASGWTRTDGRVVVESLTALGQSGFLRPVLLDEFGNTLVGLVATGANAQGTAEATGGTFCEDWTSTRGVYRRGSSNAIGPAWTNTSNESCDSPSRLFCLGIDHTQGVSDTSGADDARLAFVTSGSIAGNAGVIAFDELCQSEGQLVRPAATFLAFVAQGELGPLDRFDTSGATWATSRGTPVVDTAAGLMFGNLDAPPAWQADGSALVGETSTWTGAINASAPEQASHCEGWSVTTGEGRRGNVTQAEDWMFLGGTRPCSTVGRLLCLEE